MKNFLVTIAGDKHFTCTFVIENAKNWAEALENTQAGIENVFSKITKEPLHIQQIKEI